MREQEVEQYFRIYTDCWRLLKKYGDSNDSAEYWDEVSRSCRGVYERYETEFAKSMTLAVYKELARGKETR